MAKATGKGFHALLVTMIRKLLRENPLLTREDLDAALKSARGKAGGYAKAENARAASLADDAESDSFEELIAEVQSALQATFGPSAWSVATFPDSVVYYVGCETYPEPGDPDGFDSAWEEATEDQPDGDNDADDASTFFRATYSRDVDGSIVFGEQSEVEKDVSFVPAGDSGGAELCYEQAIDRVEDALSAAYGGRVAQLATYPARVIYALAGAKTATFSATYEVDDSGAVQLGEKTPVQMAVAWRDIAAEDAITARFSAWQNDPRFSSISLAAAKFVDKAWNGAAGRFADTDAYCRSALIDDNPPGQPKKQSLCWLPVQEPSGEYNKAALRNAAARIDQIKGASAASKASAKRRLAALLRQAGIGQDASTKAEDGATSTVYVLDSGSGTIPLPAAFDSIDWNNRGFAPVMLRLADMGRPLPEWQQLHKIGSWVVPHASGQKILITRDIGNKIITNFNRGVVRRGVPLDERHFTDQGGHALAWTQEMRWGSEGQGLPGGPEPDGVGPILYGRMRYNSLGETKLKDEQFKYISPQYWLDYVDNETGTHHGPALVAVGATNNPYLRVRSIQGEPAPEPVAALEDGLIGWTGADDMADQVKLEEVQAALAEQQAKLVALEAEREAERAELAAERKERHETEVKLYLDNAIRAGLSPALAKIASPILLNSAPKADAIISLSDDSAEPTHNLHNAVRALVDAIPRIAIGTVQTHQENKRPEAAYDPTQPTALDDQVVRDRVKQMRELAGLVDPRQIDGILASTARSDEK